jgi:prevent-host-death family protein
MQKLTFRNSLGAAVDVTCVAVENVPSELSHIMEKAEHGGAVAITREDTPKAIVLSYDEFEKLVRGRSNALERLDKNLDSMMAKMQTPKARKAAEKAFNMTPAELGRAAVWGARKTKAK